LFWRSDKFLVPHISMTIFTYKILLAWTYSAPCVLTEFACDEMKSYTDFKYIEFCIKNRIRKKQYNVTRYLKWICNSLFAFMYKTLSQVYMWHEGSKPEFWSEKKSPLLGYDTVNTRWRYWASISCYATVGNIYVIAAKVTQATIEEPLEAVFSAGSALALYTRNRNGALKSSASRRRRRKGDPVPGGVIGPPCSGGI
jgi:hypothetical protein